MAFFISVKINIPDRSIITFLHTINSSNSLYAKDLFISCEIGLLLDYTGRFPCATLFHWDMLN